MARPGGTLATFPLSDTGLFVSFQASGTLYDMLNRKRGQRRVRWTEVERILERYYETMAMELQALVVEESQKSRLRPNVSTGRMDKATLDARNRRISKGGFGIGYWPFLENSDAKYARQIEKGFTDHATQGRHVYGMFGATITGRFNRFASGRNPAAGPEWSYVGMGSGGKFMPKGRLPAAARRQHFGGKGLGREGRPTRMIIRNPIVAQDAYGRAYARFRKGNRAFLIFRAIVMSELGLSSDQVPRSYQGIVDNVF